MKISRDVFFIGVVALVLLVFFGVLGDEIREGRALAEEASQKVDDVIFLPDGAVVKSVSIDRGRMAVTYLLMDHVFIDHFYDGEFKKRTEIRGR